MDEIKKQQPLKPPVIKNPENYKALLVLQAQEASLKARRGYVKAYLLSFFIPPFGLYYCIKYLFFADTTSENRKAGIISLMLTTISLFLNIWLLSLFFTQSMPLGNTNTEFINDLITPGNQEDLIKLLQ